MAISGREDWVIVPHKWTQYEMDYLAANYGTLSVAEMARTMRRSIKSVHTQLTNIRRNGSLDALRRSNSANAHNATRKWTEEDFATLARGISEGRSVAEIAAELGRTRSAVEHYWCRYHPETRARSGHDSRLTDGEIGELRAMLAQGMSRREIHLKTGHSYETIDRHREEKT